MQEMAMEASLQSEIICFMQINKFKIKLVIKLIFIQL